MATHPHHRRLPRHARHLISQMLKIRTATRSSVLQTHARQLDSAVNLSEDRDRLHPDYDRHARGVRVVIGPETRSLLRQLLESRDLRVQQQLVREIIHQLEKRTIAALKRIRRVEKAVAMAGQAASRVRRSGLWPWFAALPRRARGRITRAAVSGRGSRTTTRLSRSARVSRTRVPGPEAREPLALGRTGMSRAKPGSAPARARRAART